VLNHYVEYIQKIIEFNNQHKAKQYIEGQNSEQKWNRTYLPKSTPAI